jgi:hypothetical protein
MLLELPSIVLLGFASFASLAWFLLTALVLPSMCYSTMLLVTSLALSCMAVLAFICWAVLLAHRVAMLVKRVLLDQASRNLPCIICLALFATLMLLCMCC